MVSAFRFSIAGAKSTSISYACCFLSSFEVCAEIKKIVEEFGADDITANQKQNKAGVPPFPVIVGI